MKVHTSNYKDTIKTMGREIDSQITYIKDGLTTILTSEKINSVVLSYEGAILKSVMKKLDIDSNYDIPKGTEINYKFGVKVNGTYEYLNFGNYIVFSSEKQEDSGSYKIVCYDKMLNAMVLNTDLGITYPITIRNYIKTVCSKIGLVFKNESEIFANYDKVIDKELYLGLDYTFRDILDELAQVTASTICIDDEDRLEIRYISNTSVDTIDEEYLKDVNVNFGQKYGPINSIVLSRGEADNVYLKDEQSVNDNGLCEVKIKDNQIMNWNDRSDYLPDILNKLGGLTYYLNDFASTGITYLELCDRYNVSIDDRVYSCVMFNDEINITQGLVENIDTDMPEEAETDYTKADKMDRKINQVSIIVDKQQQKIQALSKKVQDVSNTIIGTGLITLTDCNETPLYRLVITGDDSLTFPSKKTFPSSTTYLKTSLLYLNKGTDNEKVYDLKIPALRKFGNVSDEYILEKEQAKLIRRIGLNSNLEKYILEKEIVTDLGKISIELEEGDNTLIIPSFSNFKLEATYLLKNDYTDIFATTAYVDNEITINSDNVLLQSKSYTDTATKGDALISKINLDSTGNVKIEASKSIDMSGTTINMTADNVKIQGKNLDISSDGIIKLIDNSAEATQSSIEKKSSYRIRSEHTETYEGKNATLIENHTIYADGRKVEYENNNQITGSTGYGHYYGGIEEQLYRYPRTTWYVKSDIGTLQTIISNSSISMLTSENGATETQFNVNAGVVTCVSLIQTSLKENKKDFEKYNNALEEIKKIDIYKYNLKNEDVGTKKHLGFVIGNEFNYSQLITDNSNRGVDNYAFTSLCLQAIKEQQIIIEKLNKKIEQIEERMIKNGI